MDDCFFEITNLSNTISLPDKLDYPFFYTPHPLAKFAAAELQRELETRNFNHDFGLGKNERNGSIGKMFGVLVVRSKNGKIGYIKAFSGKLGESNFHKGFVPPIFDILEKNSFFKKEEVILNRLNQEIKNIEFDENVLFLKQKLRETELNSQKELQEFKTYLKDKKKDRDTQRQVEQKKLSENEYNILLEKLKIESINQQLEYKKLSKLISENLTKLHVEVNRYNSQLAGLKEIRKEKSNLLQNKIFENYNFLNKNKEERSLLSIFEESIFKLPPAGAGECAAPKLFQYAFLNDFEPICMAEFWWGIPPDSEVKSHKHFYPACKGKCEPILNHMLSGSRVEDSPFTHQNNPEELDIIYEDECLVAVNKPAEFLSVPGKILKDSILTRLRLKYPEATGPLLLHRLDMSTSGILLAAKTQETFKYIQKQFINQKIRKIYHAILDGNIKEGSGTIDLPLNLDIFDRPKQKVCFENGKNSLTKFTVLKRKNGKSLVEFRPHTGRTHQLRIHSAHHLGLNCPILGDDLYGIKETRLYLHAFQLTFTHPTMKSELTIRCDSEFEYFL
ncbi:MAG: pseudouridine synthase [Bacteroidota bacterium]